eukprot:TRINITY_DN1340_c0_g2_i1.p1 TRINITY_DN1340_c0_g2~~TRINITY_DN1340_c0_g2_i1.p1  ORF type:complete len:371 (+),score=93.29 TRINITY_DN1340_c0_g2_i1:481-1593(+)
MDPKSSGTPNVWFMKPSTLKELFETELPTDTTLSNVKKTIHRILKQENQGQGPMSSNSLAKEAGRADGVITWAFRTPHVEPKDPKYNPQWNDIMWEHCGIMLQTRGDEMKMLMRTHDHDGLRAELAAAGYPWAENKLKIKFNHQIQITVRHLRAKWAVDSHLLDYCLPSKPVTWRKKYGAIEKEMKAVATAYSGPVVRQHDGVQFQPLSALIESLAGAYISAQTVGLLRGQISEQRKAVADVRRQLTLRELELASLETECRAVEQALQPDVELRGTRNPATNASTSASATSTPAAPSATPVSAKLREFAASASSAGQRQLTRRRTAADEPTQAVPSTADEASTRAENKRKPAASKKMPAAKKPKHEEKSL